MHHFQDDEQSESCDFIVWTELISIYMRNEEKEAIMASKEKKEEDWSMKKWSEAGSERITSKQK